MTEEKALDQKQENRETLFGVLEQTEDQRAALSNTDWHQVKETWHFLAFSVQSFCIFPDLCLLQVNL